MSGSQLLSLLRFLLLRLLRSTLSLAGAGPRHRPRRELLWGSMRREEGRLERVGELLERGIQELPGERDLTRARELQRDLTGHSQVCACSLREIVYGSSGIS